MATLQQVCDAIETLVNTIDNINMYDTAEELPEVPNAGVCGELNVEDIQFAANCGQRRANMTLVLSVPCAVLGWGQATRLLRPYIDMDGNASIVDALIGSSATGGTLNALGAAVGAFMSGRERTVDFGKEKRRVATVAFEVMF